MRINQLISNLELVIEHLKAQGAKQEEVQIRFIVDGVECFIGGMTGGSAKLDDGKDFFFADVFICSSKYHEQKLQSFLEGLNQENGLADSENVPGLAIKLNS